MLEEERGPGPEPLYAGGLMLSTVLKKYLQSTNPVAHEILSSKLDDMSKRIHQVGILHSTFKDKQRGHIAN